MTSILLVSAALLINKNNQIIITQRPQGKPLAGLWEFPGGKVETGETPEEALQRELKEELNINALVKEMEPLSFASFTYPKFHLLMPLFVIRRWTGDLTPKENQALKAISLSELKNFDMPPADIPLIPLIESFLQNEIL
ncbi:8-oxo-dGTP diphosphatase MutT [Acetobacteraceae bacterium]|nr:8-oxo-dGTP diphosphatase MutT [Acetobacteraceae bacterium]